MERTDIISKQLINSLTEPNMTDTETVKLHGCDQSKMKFRSERGGGISGRDK